MPCRNSHRVALSCITEYGRESDGSRKNISAALSPSNEHNSLSLGMAESLLAWLCPGSIAQPRGEVMVISCSCLHESYGPARPNLTGPTAAPLSNTSTLSLRQRDELEEAVHPPKAAVANQNEPPRKLRIADLDSRVEWPV